MKVSISTSKLIFFHNWIVDSIDLEDCVMSADASGLSWDAVCFVFLLLQLRIYKSHYFRHIVTELMIENKLEAR